ncbi:hypothetical protein G7059_08025 [Erysipelothrix sp. HDW6A]|nr:hypothetical protein [Erysipelothrix sp. HDW6A]QIK57789.1 hypothetical protein G7059_08025 [Erysipelothrix sp. HDW6A]
MFNIDVLLNILFGLVLCTLIAVVALLVIILVKQIIITVFIEDKENK